MSTTGLKEIDHTTNIWLKDLMEELDWDDRHRAYKALRAVLHALRDRLPPQTAVHLGSQLPMLVRGFYLECWRITDKPLRERSVEQFFADVTDEFEVHSADEAREVTYAVFDLLARHVSAGEIEDVKATLPKAIRKLWQ